MQGKDQQQERATATVASTTTTRVVLPKDLVGAARADKDAAVQGGIADHAAGALPYSWIKPSVVQPDLGLLDQTGRAFLLTYGHERAVDAGTVVARAGDRVSEIAIVTRGELELRAHVHGARITAGLVRAGGVVADIPFLIQTPMPYDAIASRETDLITLTGQMWTQLVTSSPSLALRWMTSIARRLDDDRRRLVMITSRPLIAQIAYLLVSMCESDDNGAPVVKLSQSTIAQLLGARRQSVTRAVSELRKQGLIQTAYASILLVDPPALRRLMGGDPLP